MSAATQVRSLAPLAESLIWWHGGADRRFHAHRTDDISTVSGIGVVAVVTECVNGLVVTLWRDHADGTPGNVEVSVSIDECLAESAPTPARKLNGAAMRDFRIKAGLTQTDLAFLIPTGTGTIKQLELGTRGASKHRIAQLAEALGCSIEALTCCEGQP